MFNFRVIINSIIKYFSKKKFGYQNYPKKFRYIIKSCYCDNLPKDKKLKKKNSSLKFKVKLASQYFYLNTNSFYKNMFYKDQEDYGYLHRWSWAINLLMKKKKIDIKTKKFIEDNISNWFYNNQSVLPDIKKIEWYPYNISERLSNYALLYDSNNIKKDTFFFKHLTTQMFFLAKNIELYSDKLSNHALNNLRGIFLFSCISNNNKFKIFSIKFILYLCEKFIDQEGFFKFGSSHYQFIFTKWLAEIYYFGKKYKVKEIYNLKKYLNKSLEACVFFTQKNERNEISYPLFGNISPDFTPVFLINYFQKKSLKENNFLAPQVYNRKINRIMGNSEWIKIENKNHTIYFRNPKINGFNFNHAHSDFFHFVHYYKGSPIIVDLGRKNYLNEGFDYTSGLAHNSVIINNNDPFQHLLKKKILVKLGLLKTTKDSYTVTRQKYNVTFKALFKDNSIIKRKFELKEKSIIIETTIDNKSTNNNFDMPMFLDKKINIIKKDKYNISLIGNSFKSSIKVITTNKIFKANVIKKSKKNIYGQCSSYGNIDSLNCINLKFIGQNKFTTRVEINF